MLHYTISYVPGPPDASQRTIEPLRGRFLITVVIIRIILMIVALVMIYKYIITINSNHDNKRHQGAFPDSRLQGKQE